MTLTPNDTDMGARQREELARAGDRTARSELLEAARAGLARFCFRYLGNVDDAEDMAQEVLARLTLAERWPGGALRPFLLRAARNRCLDSMRRRQDGRIGVGSFLGFSSPGSSAGPSTRYARREGEERLREHMLALAPHHSEVLFLRYFEDLDRKEIAEVLELSVPVVKSRLFEARKELRRRMGDSAP